MPKFSISATELTDTDVNFVSLVKRGANRIPFRVTKEDTEMTIDLHKIGRAAFMKAEKAPAVVAIVTQKADLDPDVLQQIAEAVGLTGDLKKSEDNGVVAFSKSDVPADVMLIKLDDDVALAVTGTKLDKAFSGYDFTSTDFKDVVGTNGFVNGLCTAADALSGTISNIMYSAEEPAQAGELISKALDDYKAYVVSLTSAIPVQAFKADVALSKAAKGKAKKPGDNDGDEGACLKADAGKNGTGAGVSAPTGNGTSSKATADDKANTEVNAKPGEKVSGAKKEDVKGLPDPTGESPAGEGAAQAPDHSGEASATADDKKTPNTQGQPGGATLDTAGIPDKALAKNDGDADIGKKGKGNQKPDDESGAGAQKGAAQKAEEPVMQAIQALAKSFQESLAAVTQKMDHLNERVDGVATMAKKTDAALNGTVFNETNDDRVATQKADHMGAIPLLDTAYNRRGAA